MNLTAREPPWRSMAVVTADELKSRFGITNPRTCRRLAQAAQVTTPPSQTSVAALSLCEAVDFLTCACCVRCVLVPIVCVFAPCYAQRLRLQCGYQMQIVVPPTRHSATPLSARAGASPRSALPPMPACVGADVLPASSSTAYHGEPGRAQHEQNIARPHPLC